MDYDPHLFRKLFEGTSQSFEDDLDASKYLSELSSCSASKLASEPARLSEQNVQLHEEAESLAFTHYKTFIEAANCSKELRDEFSIINKDVNSLLTGVPELELSCRSFLSSAQELGSARRLASLTLQRHPQLLELLEIVQVMDTCVRGGYYEEALELAQFVTKLQRRLSHIPIVEKIANEVLDLRSSLCSNLLDQLHGNLTLPNALKILSYLRRLSIFSDTELRIVFLQARDVWFQTQIQNLPDDDPYQHLIKLIETSRTHLFDIVTQYRAVFSDEEPLSLSLRDPNIANPGGIFQSWLQKQIDWFLGELEVGLTKDVGDRLDSILAQTMYFGLSFGRVGADFRGLVAPIFLRASYSQFERNVSMGMEIVVKMVKQCEKLELLIDPNPASSQEIEGQNPLNPPCSLLSYPVLGYFCNCVLNGFNSLRTCTPVPIAHQVAASIEGALICIASALMDKVDGVFSSPKESSLRDTLVTVLVPYVNRCLDEVYPRPTLLQSLGFSSVDQSPNLKNLGRVDVYKIAEAMKMDLSPIPVPSANEEPLVELPDTEPEIKNDDAASDNVPDHQLSIHQLDQNQMAESVYSNENDPPPRLDNVESKEYQAVTTQPLGGAADHAVCETGDKRTSSVAIIEEVAGPVTDKGDDEDDEDNGTIGPGLKTLTEMMLERNDTDEVTTDRSSEVSGCVAAVLDVTPEVPLQHTEETVTIDFAVTLDGQVSGTVKGVDDNERKASTAGWDTEEFASGSASWEIDEPVPDEPFHTRSTPPLPIAPSKGEKAD